MLRGHGLKEEDFPRKGKVSIAELMSWKTKKRGFLSLTLHTKRERKEIKVHLYYHSPLTRRRREQFEKGARAFGGGSCRRRSGYEDRDPPLEEKKPKEKSVLGEKERGSPFLLMPWILSLRKKEKETDSLSLLPSTETRKKEKGSAVHSFLSHFE